MSEIDIALSRIEAHLAGLEATTRLLVASRLIEDGHATDWKAAARIARDPERLRTLYPTDGEDRSPQAEVGET